MAAPAFGFSVGDFIAGVSLVRKLIRALNDSAGARASYRQLISELFDLDEALTGASNLQLNPAQSAQKIALEQVVSQCQLSITAFIDKNAKFKESLGVAPGQPTSTPRWRAILHKIKWALCKDNGIQSLRTEIQAHTRTLNLLLSTIQMYSTILNALLGPRVQADKTSRASLRLQEQGIDTCANLAQRTQTQTIETHALVQQNHHLLASQAQQIASVARSIDGHPEGATESDDLKLLVTNVMESNAKISITVLQIEQLLSNIPPQVDRQQPIVFEDAHGRQLPLHIELINSFPAFQAVLEARFRDVPGLKKVKNLEYTVHDVASRRKIDLTKPWESTFRPGRRMNMSVIFQQNQAQSSSCPGCFSENIVVGDDTNEDVQWSVLHPCRFPAPRFA